MDRHLGKIIAGSTWAFLILGEYTISFEIVPKWFISSSSVTFWGYFWFLTFQVFFTLALVSHIRASLSEPGYTPRFPVPGDIPIEKIRYCEKCDQWKPDRTHHCRTCNRCIHKMDHHCPWINNCVGAKNQKFFTCFLLYVFLCCLEMLGLIIYIMICYSNLRDKTFKGGLISFMIGVFTGVIALVFLCFTAAMFYDQIDVIVSNQTEVEKMAKMVGKEKSWRQSLRESLGESAWGWFNPFVDSPEPDYSEELYKQTDRIKRE